MNNELSQAELDDRLFARVAVLARDQWQVESKTSNSVILSRPKKIKFWLNLLLSLITGGLWLIYVLYRVVNRQRESRIVRISKDGIISDY
jgi:CHASE1-domain containing sensor protein